MTKLEKLYSIKRGGNEVKSVICVFAPWRRRISAGCGRIERKNGGVKCMTHLFFLHNDFSFAHQLDVPFISWFGMIITFSITTQIPWVHHLNGFVRKLIYFTNRNCLVLLPTELSVTYLFAAFLRLTTGPISYRRLFLASAHKISYVVRGRNLLLRHSVKHHETLFFESIINCVKVSGCKSTKRIQYINNKDEK